MPLLGAVHDERIITSNGYNARLNFVLIYNIYFCIECDILLISFIDKFVLFFKIRIRITCDIHLN